MTAPGNFCITFFRKDKAAMKMDTGPSGTATKGSRIRPGSEQGLSKDPATAPLLATCLPETRQEEGYTLPHRGIRDLPRPNQGQAGGLPYEHTQETIT